MNMYMYENSYNVHVRVFFFKYFTYFFSHAEAAFILENIDAAAYTGLRKESGG